jgi:hypothetical protein
VHVKHPELVLAGAVVVSLPMAKGLLSGNISPTAGAVRFLVALIVCWILGSVLSWVVSNYTEQSRRRTIIRAIEEAQRAERDAPAEPAEPDPAA